ncbi:MAG: YncE family protein [Nitrospinota bacterium]
MVIFFLLVLQSFSCTHSFKNPEKSKKKIESANLLVYFYLPDTNPVDINFLIEKIEIRSNKKVWTPLNKEPILIESLSLAGKQIALVRANVPEGTYSTLRFVIPKGDIRWEDKRMSLSPPTLPFNVPLSSFKVEPERSSALFLNWYPANSIVDNYLLSPDVKVMPPHDPPLGLTLYVANSGSDYISVINRFENRVVKILNVGKSPTEIVLDKLEERLYVLNSQSRTVTMINTNDNNILDQITLASGVKPTDMAFIPDDNQTNEGKLYITNSVSNDVSVLDTEKRSQVKVINVGTSPEHIVPVPERNELYVSNAGDNTVSVIDSLNDNVKATLKMSSRPADLFLHDEELYVLERQINQATVIDLASKKVSRVFSVGDDPVSGLYSDEVNRIFVLNYFPGKISFFVPPAAFVDSSNLIPASPLMTRSVRVGNKPVKVVFDFDRSNLYVTNFGDNAVSVVNPYSEFLETVIPVGIRPVGIAFIK